METPIPPRTPIEKIVRVLGILLFIEPVGYFLWVYFTNAPISKHKFVLYLLIGVVGATLTGIATGMERVRLRKHHSIQPPRQRSRWKKYLLK